MGVDGSCGAAAEEEGRWQVPRLLALDLEIDVCDCAWIGWIYRLWDVVDAEPR